MFSYANGEQGQSWLDRIIGDEGIKTDVRVTLSNEDYLKFGSVVVVSIILGTVIGNAISGK